MVEKIVRRAIGDGAPRSPAAAPQPNPSHLHQHVECAAAYADTAYLFNLGTGDGLVVGDDRQSLDSGLRQAACDGAFLLQQKGEVGCGAEGPLARDFDQGDAASLVALGQFLHERRNVDAFGQARSEAVVVERLVRRKEQGLDHPQVLRRITHLVLG